MRELRQKAIIVDLDGTLVDVSGLREYVEGRNTDYEAFHQKVQHRPINKFVAALVDLYREEGHTVIIVTARQECYAKQTEVWLNGHDVKWDMLLMRPTGDTRGDAEVKLDILQDINKFHDVMLAFDDSPETTQMWLKYDIPTLVIPGWGKGD